MSANHHRKSLQQMVSDRPWTSAEQRLLGGARYGLVILSDKRPDTPSDPVEIRADLLRHLLLGGCDAGPVDHGGPYVRGAWISGTLDLEMIRSDLALGLESCTVENTPILWDASLYGLALTDSRVPGLQAQRLKITGPVYLSGKDFVSTGTVNLGSARIGDSLVCDGGTFDGNGQAALTASGATIGGSLFLNNGFSAKGTVTLIRASVAGQVACVGGTFDGDLNADTLTVKAGLLWRDVAKISGALNLTDAHVGVLVDDWPSWAKTDKMHLNGFRYDRLTSLMTVQQRLDWLAKKQDATIEPPFGAPFDFHGRTYNLPTPFIHGSYKPKCDPQPYTQ